MVNLMIVALHEQAGKAKSANFCDGLAVVRVLRFHREPHAARYFLRLSCP